MKSSRRTKQAVSSMRPKTSKKAKSAKTSTRTTKAGARKASGTGRRGAAAKPSAALSRTGRKSAAMKPSGAPSRMGGRGAAEEPSAAPFEGPGLGAQAPTFDLETGDGTRVALSDFTGKKNVVLYFYPKDMTSGCTIEACAFRDSIGKIRSVGAEILGVSMDSPSSHKKFAEKYSLPFPLLADTGGAISKAYGVYKEKSLYGRKFWGIERSTFVIDREGRIRKLWRKVKVAGHDQDVLAALAEA